MGLLRRKKSPVEEQKPAPILLRHKKKNKQKEESSKVIRSYSFEEKSQNNYFSLLLSTNYKDLELYIRGLTPIKKIDKNGNKTTDYKKKEGHFLSEVGADMLLSELSSHCSSDVKLGRITREEFQLIMTAIKDSIWRFIMENLYELGMNSEEKQRNATVLFTKIMYRIFMNYSRSIGGKENDLSHGDIKITGSLDEDSFSELESEGRGYGGAV